MFGQEHALFLDENVHSNSSTLLSFTCEIIDHSKWSKMAPRRDELTLEARVTVCPGAEIHLGCIRRMGVIWSYEFRLSSTTCQNDCYEESYTRMDDFFGYGNVWVAKTGLQN